MVDLSVKSPEVSIMVQGSQELATNHFLLDPCPETYLATSVASPISSAMTKGNEELGSGKILLNPCADPFFPKNYRKSQLCTQPEVVQEIYTTSVNYCGPATTIYYCKKPFLAFWIIQKCNFVIFE